MVINALNCGANVFMADFEDSNAPTWTNMIEGSSICATPCAARSRSRAPKASCYALNEKTATLLVRPRGWHLVEHHVEIDGEPVSGVDLRFRALLLPQREGAARRAAPGRTSICRRWKAISKRGCGTTFSSTAQRELGMPHGTIKATVLIETVLAAFEMDEILYELRDHCVGLNIGRWDYIFSCIKKFRSQTRTSVSPTAPRSR